MQRASAIIMSIKHILCCLRAAFPNHLFRSGLCSHTLSLSFIVFIIVCDNVCISPLPLPDCELHRDHLE